MQFIVPSFPANVGGASVPQTTINNSAATWLPSNGQIPYVVAMALDPNNSPIQVILTNQSLAQAVYTANQPNPAGWDSLFQEAFVSTLAAFLVPALSLSVPLMQMSIQRAERMIVQARTADGNEGVTVMDHIPDWILARAGAQGYGYGYNNNTLLGFSNIAWPDAGGFSIGD